MDIHSCRDDWRPGTKGVGLNALHARPVRTSLGCREGYMPGGHDGPHVSVGPSLTLLQTVSSHRPMVGFTLPFWRHTIKFMWVCLQVSS